MRYMRVIILVSLAVALAPSSAISADDKFVAAFENDKSVRTAIDILSADGYESTEKPNSIMVAGSCGVVGCSAIVLVLQVMQTSGANTQTNNVAATVTRDATGNRPLEVAVVGFSPKYDQ